MSIPVQAAEVLNREFLEVRARLLELAAAFDRMERASGNVAGDPRMEKIQQALLLLQESGSGRAEEVHWA
jgi:hypothetical protein